MTLTPGQNAKPIFPGQNLGKPPFPARETVHLEGLDNAFVVTGTTSCTKWTFWIVLPL